MPRKRAENGRFESAIARQVISVKVLPELAEVLRKLPNRNKYIEALLFEKAAFSGIFDSNWEYAEEWEHILDLFIYAGSTLLKIQQCEERGEVGDNLIALLEKNIEKWLETKK